MIATLISPEQVLELAFGHSYDLSPQNITPSDIAAATSRYITPVMGQQLMQCVMEGKYPDLSQQYVAPALACAVRLMVQPSLNIRTADSGLIAPRGETMTPPSTAAAQQLMHSLKIRTRELVGRLSDHLNTSCNLYAEYNPKNNILNRCSIDGGLIQIF